MSNADDFKPWLRELKAQWPEAQAYEHAVKLVASYELDCETYDRTVCTGPIMRGRGIIPATIEQRRLIEQHAHKRKDELRAAVRSACIDDATMLRAVRATMRYADDLDMLRRIIGK